MALSEAKKAADRRHMKKLDNIMVRPYRKEGEAIRAAAAAANQSVQGYILQAVRERMERERAGAVHDGLTADGTGAEDLRRMTKSITEVTGGSDDIGKAFAFSGDEDAPQAAVAPAPDERSSPSGLSPDDWAEWARREDDEPIEDWRIRLKKSNIGTSPANIIKRISKLPKHDRELILGTGPARDGKSGNKVM